jgi:hypothetical protein
MTVTALQLAGLSHDARREALGGLSAAELAALE